eukprot:Amastigsp_a176941_22.p3 type:complete len:179 gc:universal Amastigsp_a176941_22:825-1361(+)
MVSAERSPAVCAAHMRLSSRYSVPMTPNEPIESNAAGGGTIDGENGGCWPGDGVNTPSTSTTIAEVPDTAESSPARTRSRCASGTEIVVWNRARMAGAWALMILTTVASKVGTKFCATDCAMSSTGIKQTESVHWTKISMLLPALSVTDETESDGVGPENESSAAAESGTSTTVNTST